MFWTANQGYGTGLISRTIITGIQPKRIRAVVERRQLAVLDRTTGTAEEWAEVGCGMWARSGSQIELRIGERRFSEKCRSPSRPDPGQLSCGRDLRFKLIGHQPVAEKTRLAWKYRRNGTRMAVSTYSMSAVRHAFNDAVADKRYGDGGLIDFFPISGISVAYSVRNA